MNRHIDTVLERMARAMAEADCSIYGIKKGWFADSYVNEVWRNKIPHARAALQVIHDIGV